MDPNCLFCRIVAGEIPARLLFEDDEIIAFADIAPQAPVHLLIVPKRHIPHLLAIPAADAGKAADTADAAHAESAARAAIAENTANGADIALLGRMMTTATGLARHAGLDDQGFRLVMNCLAGAGQSVFHLHLHLLGGRPLGWPPG